MENGECLIPYSLFPISLLQKIIRFKRRLKRGSCFGTVSNVLFVLRDPTKLLLHPFVADSLSRGGVWRSYVLRG